MSRSIISMLMLSILLISCGADKPSDDKPPPAPEKKEQPIVDGEVAKSVKNNSAVPIDATAAFSTEQKEYFLALGTSNLKDLPLSEKDKVASILWQQLLQSRPLVVAQQICHAQSLEGDRPCQEVLDKCGSMLSKFSEESYRAEIKRAERGIHARFLQAIKESEMPAIDLELVFEYHDEFIRGMSDFDCSTPSEELERGVEAIENSFVTKYSKAKYDKIKSIAQKYLIPFLTPTMKGPNPTTNIGR